MPYVIKNSFKGGIVDESLSAQIDLPRYNESCKDVKNFILQPQGGVYRRPGLRFIAEPALDGTPTGAAVQPTLAPLIYNSETSYIIALLQNNYKVYTDKAYLAEGLSFLTEEQNKIADYAQSADTLYLTHKNVISFKILRLNPTTFDEAILDFAGNFPSPTGFASSPTPPGGSVTVDYAITAITDSGQESLPAFVTEAAGWSPEGWGANNKITLTWNVVALANGYNIYKKSQGIYGFIGNDRGTLSFIDRNYAPVITNSTPEANNPFAGYPGSVTLFQQRLWFANTPTKPQTVFASRIGDFENMNFSPFIRPDDSIENVIYSGRPDGIQWIVPHNKVLKVGTVERIWNISSPSGGGITPSDIDISPILDWGASKVKPILAGNSLIYVENRGSKLFDVFERQEYLGDTGTNLSVNAPDLFEGFEIVSMAYQRTPDPIVWCVRSDGKVVSMTYSKNEDMWGWHFHETDGLFKNVVVIPGDVYDEVYFTVLRNSKFLIEMLEDKWNGNDIDDAKFLDSMVTKEDVTPFTIVTGLGHLEGKTVYALADGLVEGPFTVASSQVTLPSSVNTAHIGLPYSSHVRPLSVEFATRNEGVSLGKIKTISDVTLRLKNSKGGKIGPRLDYLDDISSVDYDAATIFSGDVKKVAPNDYNTDSSFFIVQDDPLPMTVSALFINVDMGDR